MESWLQHIVDLKDPASLELVRYLEHQRLVKPENRSLESALKHATCWCNLSTFLYSNRDRNLMISEPSLQFQVEFTQRAPCSTSVHWFNSFYQVDLLSAQLIKVITLKTGELALGAKLDKPLLSLSQLELTAARKLVIACLQTIYLLNLVLHTIESDCIGFQKEKVVEALKIRLLWIRLVCVWLAALVGYQPDDEEKVSTAFRLFQGVRLLLAENSELVQDEFIGKIARFLNTQLYLCGAKLNLEFEESHRSIAHHCYSKAKQEGYWKPHKEAQELLDEPNEPQEQQPLECEKEGAESRQFVKEVYYTGMNKLYEEQVKKLKLKQCNRL